MSGTATQALTVDTEERVEAWAWNSPARNQPDPETSLDDETPGWPLTITMVLASLVRSQPALNSPPDIHESQQVLRCCVDEACLKCIRLVCPKMVQDLGRLAPALPYICEQYPHPQGPPSPTNPAYVYIAVILQTLGKEMLVSDVWFYLAGCFTTEDGQITLARRIREGLLKASGLVGFPRGINGMAALKSAIKHTSPALQEELERDKPRLQSVSKADREARGMAFFSRVYAQHAQRIFNNLAETSGGDLSEFVVKSVYGDLLAEESILNAKDTALLEFACCYASGAYPQAKGHMYGSRNLGNTRKEVEGIIALSHAIADILGVEIQREGTEEWAFLEKLKSW